MKKYLILIVLIAVLHSTICFAYEELFHSTTPGSMGTVAAIYNPATTPNTQISGWKTTRVQVATSGTVTHFVIRLYANLSSANIGFGVWDGSANADTAPGTLRLTGIYTGYTTTDGAGWYAIPFTSPTTYTVTAGQYYDLAFYQSAESSIFGRGNDSTWTVKWGPTAASDGVYNDLPQGADWTDGTHFAASSTPWVMGLLIAPLGAPNTITTSGTWTHGSTNAVISGLEFGTKSPVAPLIWDDGETKTVNNYTSPTTENDGYGVWKEARPSGADSTRDSHRIQYRNIPYRSTPAPHSKSTKYLVGGHWNDWEELSQDVGVSIYESSPTDVWYASWYIRLDSKWPTASGSACYGDVMNYKDWTISNATTMFAGAFAYWACAGQTECVWDRTTTVHLASQAGYCGAGGGEDPTNWRHSENGSWIRLEKLVRMNPGYLYTYSYKPTVSRISEFQKSCAGNLFSTVSPLRTFTVGGYLKTSEQTANGGSGCVRSLTDSDWYEWIESPSKAGEFYVRGKDLTSPDVTVRDPDVDYKPPYLYINGVSRTEGTAGSLTDYQWDYADNDGLGYSTVYVKLPSGVDPDTLSGSDNCYIHVLNTASSNQRLEPDAFRYFDDIYVDNTWSRVMLCDSSSIATSTICEPQIPHTTWNSTTIQITVNQGGLSEGTNYLFVFDSDNVANTTGVAVTLGGTTPPSAQGCTISGGTFK